MKPRPDGTLREMRWVPSSRGLALSFLNCGSCHVRVMPDGANCTERLATTEAPESSEIAPG